MDYKETIKLLDSAKKILIVQGENLDADSLASSLALEELLEDQGKSVTMYCQVTVPTYLGYIEGSDRVTNVFPRDTDLIIIVDTASKDLLQKTLEQPESTQFKTKPTIVIDHHETEIDFEFECTKLIDSQAASTSVVIYDLATSADWDINSRVAEYFVQSIMGDTQGLSNASTNTHAIEVVLEMVKLGVNLSELEDRRRSLMKKSKEILAYKGELINRIDYHLDGQLATITIPWEEIEEYSHAYNPSMLVIDEMRMVEGVKIAIAYKTYPNGKILGKIRSNSDTPIAEKLALEFAGGGHPCASGFKIFDETIEETKTKVLKVLGKLL